ncbi:MAG TPA: ferric reductase-like transmembrane domain-containing protein [Mycobacteriales bacterium]|nr:ferric reductase-like transmembrane domain-containing protein [Mycobacteriales bacterium]
MAVVNGVGILWLVSRATGLVAFALLTAALVAGAVATGPTASRRWPRWARQLLHRDLALLAVGVLAVHISSVVLDGYVPIGWLSVVVPFTAGYRPLAVTAGTLAFDTILVVVGTSLLRARLGYRAWRVVHWLVFLAWPLAALHFLGVGTDFASWWGRAIAVVGVLCVAAALVIRRPAVALAGSPR